MAWQKRKAGKMVWQIAVVPNDDALEARLGKLVAKGAFVHTIDFAHDGTVRIVTCQREKPQPKKKAVKADAEP